MASTIKLKNGSGAPLASDLVQGEPALDLTNKRLYTEDSGGTVIEVGTNPTEITTGHITATGTTTITTADINGGTIDGVTIGGASAGAGTFTTVTGSGDMNIDSGTLFVDASENRVGIGTTSPATQLELSTNNNAGTALNVLRLSDTDTTAGADQPSGRIEFYTSDSNNVGVGSAITGLAGTGGTGSAKLAFDVGGSEHMRLDSSGNLLVGTTDALPVTNNDSNGIALRADGNAQFSRASAATARFNRKTNDGEIVSFSKDGTTVGSISSVSGVTLDIDGGAFYTGIRFDSASWSPRDNGAVVDNSVDLGKPTARFDDIYATNGTIQTSDRNEKQDIETLSEAEQRVAVACKGLLRKYRWKSAVAEKGDDARIHFGIIAQDLQAAFEAEGLDAGRYAMFIYSEWWETQTEVPAVEAQDAVYETVVIPAVTEESLVSEAVLDEEGNEIEAAVYETVVVQEETTEERLVSEAVEAKEAYTRTDTYDTEEEAPEGAVKKSRMGVRYSELLAFIIAAI